MIKLTFITVTMIMSLGANLSDGIISRLGFNPDILLVTLIAFVVAGMIYHRNIALIILVVMMTIGANVSTETALSIGYNADYLLAGLVALVILPFVCRSLDGGLF